MPDFERYEDAIRRQLREKPARLEHSLGVAACARELACAYDVDRDAAYVAGLLHDWAKAYGRQESISRAESLGIDMGDQLERVAPLLHGPIAARELKDEFPELSEEVLQAIARHTIGAVDMTPLDAVVFVADAIEPGRPHTPSIDELRSKAGAVPIDELFFLALKSSVGYVIETGRYLYPGALSIYNALVLERNRKENE